jgi:hypothetical protein
MYDYSPINSEIYTLSTKDLQILADRLITENEEYRTKYNTLVHDIVQRSVEQAGGTPDDIPTFTEPLSIKEEDLSAFNSYIEPQLSFDNFKQIYNKVSNQQPTAQPDFKTFASIFNKVHSNDIPQIGGRPNKKEKLVFNMLIESIDKAVPR